MGRVFGRIALAIVLGWWLGVEMAMWIDSQSNLLPMFTNPVGIAVVSLLIFLIMPLMTKALYRYLRSGE